MNKILYYWSKLFKKLHSKSISLSNIHASSKIEAGSTIHNVQMDKHSFCGYDCEIVNCDIGSFTSIANGVVIGGGVHPMDWVGMSPVFYEGRDSVKTKFSEYERPKPKHTTIGHDVWIGRNCIVKAGVTIGTGSVIGMGSVVTKDVAPYTIAAGVPAKPIKTRFSPELGQRLLESEWWNLDEQKLKQIAVDIKNPEAFLKRI